MFEQFTYQDLLAFACGMSIYAVITIPIYLFWLIDTITVIIRKFKELKNDNKKKNI